MKKSAVVRARMGMKGNEYRAPIPPKPLKTAELVRQTSRRIKKAEQDERMDITASLTPVKVDFGGFTRPRDLRSSNWFPGGRYNRIGKIYEPPPESAYIPHTVYILESRYPVKHGVGRADTHDHISDICSAADFTRTVQRLNSPTVSGSARESMDNARWPWGPQRRVKRAVWWDTGTISAEAQRQQYLESPLDEIPRIDDTGPIPKAVAETKRQDLAQEILPISGLTMKKPPVKKEKTQTQADLTTTVKEDRPESSSSASNTSSPPKGVKASSPNQPAFVEQGRTMPPHIKSAASGPQKKGKKKSNEDDDDDDDELEFEEHAHGKHDSDLKDLQKQYEATFKSEPFWRPLIAVTLPTRPLALTLVRLIRSLPKGLPYHAAMTSEDRKAVLSQSTRVRCMRLNRARQLVTDILTRLDGYCGGFIGIRFRTLERGRGLNGELLDEPIRSEDRSVHVRVGAWYDRADEELQRWHLENTTSDTLQVNYMNEWGQLLSDDRQDVLSEPYKEDLVPYSIAELRELDADDINDEEFAEPEEQKARVKELARQLAERASLRRVKSYGRRTLPPESQSTQSDSFDLTV